MGREDLHLSDQELLQAADGELSLQRAAEAQEHLAACWACRTRMLDLESTIAGFVGAHRRSLDPHIPPPEGARALLKLRMSELAAGSRPNRWTRFFSPLDRAPWRAACVLVLLAVLGIWLLRSTGPGRALELTPAARLTPNPSITPGATLPVTRDDVCAADRAETVRLVPASIAIEVFEAYGIREPQPRSYELDYLITPALGGSDNIRNFWPQPYGESIWNAHIKDALEDHLHRLVCEGKVDLKTAQRDLASDWISAYKKYFHTEKPKPQHVRFLKDRPWE